MAIYYTVPAKNRYDTPPEIVFKNSHCYPTSNTVAYYDYALIRFNIVVQTAIENNDPSTPNFARSCSGNMQIYPTTFSADKTTLLLDNSYLKNGVIISNDAYTINEPTLFPNGRNIYFTDSILDSITDEIKNKLTIECQKTHGNSVVKFNFAPYDTNLDSEVNDNLSIIYSINVELLNNGKIPVHLISTNNFQTNI
jgi:hypothetical protein